MALSDEAARKYEMVAVAHDFLLAVLPIQPGASRVALGEFLEHVEQSLLSSGDLELILLRTLFALQRHRLADTPNLLDRYCAMRAENRSAAHCFAGCFDALIRPSVENPRIAKAISMVQSGLVQPRSTHSSVAENVGLAPSKFSTKFREVVGCTYSAYVREARLTRAASLLATSDRSIKEVWADVGYNHPSNFTHDFKRWFGLAPSVFRRRVRADGGWTACADASLQRTLRPLPGTELLLLYDRQPCEDWPRQSLGSDGYTVLAAASIDDALAVLAAHPIEITILDCYHVVTDALDWLQRIRAHPRHRSTPVVVCTPRWDLEPLAAGLEADGVAILMKPVAFDVVKRRVARALAKPTRPPAGSV